MMLMPDESGKLQSMVGGDTSFASDPKELGVAQWVFEHHQLAGKGTDTLPDALALYLPLTTPSGAVGVVGVRAERDDPLLAPAQRQLLTTFAGQIALALERDSLSEQAHKILAQVQLSLLPREANRGPEDNG
jgi:two-component system sensor histidine kinase KdpD